MGTCFSNEKVISRFNVNLNQHENPDKTLKNVLALHLGMTPNFDVFPLNNSLTRNATRTGTISIYSPQNCRGYLLKEKCKNGVNSYTVSKQ